MVTHVHTMCSMSANLTHIMLLQLHDAMCKARVFETAEGLKKAQKVKFAIY